MDNKKDAEQDIILDTKQDNMKVSVPPMDSEEGRIDPNYQNAKGQFIKGNPGPCPGGRPNDNGFQILLKKIFGKDSEELIYLMLAQIKGTDIGIDDVRMNDDAKLTLKTAKHKVNFSNTGKWKFNNNN